MKQERLCRAACETGEARPALGEGLLTPPECLTAGLRHSSFGPATADVFYAGSASHQPASVPDRRSPYPGEHRDQNILAPVVGLGLEDIYRQSLIRRDRDLRSGTRAGS